MITGAEANVRIDAWLAARPEVGSRARAREWIERGKIFLNGRELTFERAGQRLVAGDEVALWADRPGSSRAQPRDVVAQRRRLRVVFEDAHLLVADKPPGMLVEPLPGDPTEVTMVDLVADHLRGEPASTALVVHRIDRDTSGLVLFAKTSRDQESLKRQFERRTAERVYLAVLSGRPVDDEGTWIDTLVWDKVRLRQRRARPDDRAGKEAVLTCRTLERFADATLVEVSLVTGKRNQIRAQAALRGHPLVGEKIYRARAASARRSTSPGDVRPRASEPGVVEFPRQALHATRLAFRHPATGEKVTLTSPAPADLRQLIARLRRAGPR
jgi:23S rRNA pseudouridine1911/1915/1917 synthase